MYELPYPEKAPFWNFLPPFCSLFFQFCSLLGGPRAPPGPLLRCAYESIWQSSTMKIRSEWQVAALMCLWEQCKSNCDKADKQSNIQILLLMLRLLSWNISCLLYVLCVLWQKHSSENILNEKEKIIKLSLSCYIFHALSFVSIKNFNARLCDQLKSTMQDFNPTNGRG